MPAAGLDGLERSHDHSVLVQRQTPYQANNEAVNMNIYLSFLTKRRLIIIRVMLSHVRLSTA